MLNEREITLIRTAMILRLDQIKDRPELYQEHKSLLHKLWVMRLDARCSPGQATSPDQAIERQ